MKKSGTSENNQINAVNSTLFKISGQYYQITELLVLIIIDSFCKVSLFCVPFPFVLMFP